MSLFTHKHWRQRSACCGRREASASSHNQNSGLKGYLDQRGSHVIQWHQRCGAGSYVDIMQGRELSQKVVPQCVDKQDISKQESVVTVQDFPTDKVVVPILCGQRFAPELLAFLITTTRVTKDKLLIIWMNKNQYRIYIYIYELGMSRSRSDRNWCWSKIQDCCGSTVHMSEETLY